MQKIITTLVAVVAVVAVTAAGVFLIFTPASGNSPTPKTVNITESSNGTTLSLHIGDQVRISLLENPSTGYQWNFSIPAGFSVIEDQYSAPDGNGMVGQAGTHTFLLKANQKGTFPLSWIYKRSWETTASDQPFVVTFIVE